MRSEIEVALPRSTTDRWDIDVRQGPDIPNSAEPPPGEVLASYGDSEAAWYTVTHTGEEYFVRFRNCGEFVISANLDAIEVRPDRAGRNELLPILLAGTVSAIVLTLRGNTVLHASAVAIGDQVMAFVGQSGRGKSTMAALMCVDGALLVTDDVLVVDAGPPASCIGGAPELRLREKAAEIVMMQPGSSGRETKDDRLAFSPAVATPDQFPLRAIVIPDPSKSAIEVDIQRETPGDALLALLSFPRVHQWREPDVLSRDFMTMSELVNQVPVFRATIPWGPPFRSDIAPALAAVLADVNA